MSQGYNVVVYYMDTELKQQETSGLTSRVRAEEVAYDIETKGCYVPGEKVGTFKRIPAESIVKVEITIPSDDEDVELV